MNRFSISSLLAIVILAGLTMEVNGWRSKKCRFKGHRLKPGQKFQFLCNECVCQKGGKVKCDHVGCDKAEISKGYCKFEGKNIKKGEKFTKDCNLCICTFLQIVSCTNKICIHKDEVKVRFCHLGEKIIPPRKHFRDGCKDCICQKEGTITCDDTACKKGKNEECYHDHTYYKMNETFKVDCKICKCEEHAHLKCIPIPCCDPVTGEIVEPEKPGGIEGIIQKMMKYLRRMVYFEDDDDYSEC